MNPNIKVFDNPSNPDVDGNPRQLVRVEVSADDIIFEAGRKVGQDQAKPDYKMLVIGAIIGSILTGAVTAFF